MIFRCEINPRCCLVVSEREIWRIYDRTSESTLHTCVLLLAPPPYSQVSLCLTDRIIQEIQLTILISSQVGKQKHIYWSEMKQIIMSLDGRYKESAVTLEVHWPQDSLIVVRGRF